MPDISKCSNKHCILKENCYRYKVMSDIYQSYCFFQPIKDNNNKFICEFYIPWKSK